MPKTAYTKFSLRQFKAVPVYSDGVAISVPPDFECSTAGINKTNLANLKLKWAFAFRMQRHAEQTGCGGDWLLVGKPVW
jgi:hypothetical protein